MCGPHEASLCLSHVESIRPAAGPLVVRAVGLVYPNAGRVQIVSLRLLLGRGHRCVAELLLESVIVIVSYCTRSTPFST